jgi:hypothetical protein
MACSMSTLTTAQDSLETANHAPRDLATGFLGGSHAQPYRFPTRRKGCAIPLRTKRGNALQAVSVLLLLLASAGCTGGSGSSSEGTSTVGAGTDATAPSELAPLTRAELKAMMPSLKDFRGQGPPRNFTSPWFTYISNRAAPRESTLPNLNRAVLGEAGRVSGYEGGLLDFCGGLCVPGLLNVSTEVHVFRTAAQASRFLANQADVYPDRGEEGRYGRLASVEHFGPGVFGDEAVGVRSEALSFADETITETVIMFRIGQVVGLSSTVILNRNQYPGTYPNARAAALARLLERRISAVLAARP